MKIFRPKVTFISGLMKGGKSEELISQIKFFRQTGDTFLVIKPSVDTRDGSYVVSRATQDKELAVLIDETNEMAKFMLFNAIEYYTTVFIDESQFFSREFMESLFFHCEMNGVDLVISGLTYDFKGDVFPSSELILELADYKMYKVGYCDDCSQTAQKHILVIDGKVQTGGDSVVVETGDVEYLTVCNKCLGKRLEK